MLIRVCNKLVVCKKTMTVSQAVISSPTIVILIQRHVAFSIFLCTSTRVHSENSHVSSLKHEASLAAPETMNGLKIDILVGY